MQPAAVSSYRPFRARPRLPAACVSPAPEPAPPPTRHCAAIRRYDAITPPRSVGRPRRAAPPSWPPSWPPGTRPPPRHLAYPSFSANSASFTRPPGSMSLTMSLSAPPASTATGNPTSRHAASRHSSFAIVRCRRRLPPARPNPSTATTAPRRRDVCLPQLGGRISGPSDRVSTASSPHSDRPGDRHHRTHTPDLVDEAPPLPSPLPVGVAFNYSRYTMTVYYA